MAKFIFLFLTLFLASQTYVQGIISVEELVRLTSDPNLAISQKDWNQHFQNKADAARRLLELHYGAVGLFRSVYTTDNIRFLRNLVALGIKVGNFSLENLPDEALGPAELVSRGLAKVLFSLSPPPNAEVLETYELDDSQPSFDTAASTTSEVVSEPDTIVNFEPIAEDSNSKPEDINETHYSLIPSEERVARSVALKESEELLKKYEENSELYDELLKHYEENEKVINRHKKELNI